MTALYATQAPPGLQVVMTWLEAGGVPVHPKRKDGEPLPARMVVRIPVNTGDKLVDSAVYRIHDFAATFTAAEDNARWTERRMLALAPPGAAWQQKVILDGGQIVQADLCRCTRPYSFEYYSETVERFISEYRVDFRFIPA